MTPRVEIFKDRSGGYRWRLRAGNGQIVAQGESHTQSSDAKRAWRTVRLCAFRASWQMRRKGK